MSDLEGRKLFKTNCSGKIQTHHIKKCRFKLKSLTDEKSSARPSH